MSPPFKYAIVLAMGIAVIYVCAPLNLDVSKLARLDDVDTTIKRVFAFASPEATTASVDSARAALIDEELDYRIAQRLGSLEGWRSFLAAHGSGVYSQIASAEVQTLLSGHKAAADISNDASPDAKAAGDIARPAPLSSGTEVATLAPDTVVQSSDHDAPEVGAEVLNGASSDRKAGSVAKQSTPLSSGAESATLTPDEICKRDGDRLTQVLSSPTSDEVRRFANELGCEKLRRRLAALIMSLGYVVPSSADAPPPSLARARSVPATRSLVSKPFSETHSTASPRKLQPKRNASRCAFKAACFWRGREELFAVNRGRKVFALFPLRMAFRAEKIASR